MASSLGNTPTTSVRRLISRCSRSSGFVDPDLAPVLGREGTECEQVLSGGDEQGGHRGELGLEGGHGRSNCAWTASPEGWAKMVRMAAATISASALGTLARMLRMACTRQTPNVKLPRLRENRGVGSRARRTRPRVCTAASGPVAGDLGGPVDAGVVGGVVLPAAPEDPGPRRADGAEGPVGVLAAVQRGEIAGAAGRVDAFERVCPHQLNVSRRRGLQARRNRTLVVLPDARVTGASPASASSASTVGNRLRSSPISASSADAVTGPAAGKLAGSVPCSCRTSPPPL